MRGLALVLGTILGASLVGLASLSAAPANDEAMLKAADLTSYINVGGGCGYRMYRDRYGRCVAWGGQGHP